MAKILFEVVLDSHGAVTGFKQLEEGIKSLGAEGTKAAKGSEDQDRALTSLLNKLEPTRVAAERLAQQQQILTRGYQEGNISAERYQAGLATLQERFDRTTSSGGGMFAALKQGAAELATSLAGLFALSKMVSWLSEGTTEAMQQARALSQLSNVTQQFGGDGAAAARAATELGKSLQSIGIEDTATIAAMRDVTVQTHDYAIALSATSLAADMYARTGKSFADSLGIIEDLIAGKTRAVTRANLEFGTQAKTTQEALDALDKANRGWAAGLDDNLAKIQAAKAQLADFAKEIGGPLSSALVFVTKMFQGFGALAAGAGLAIYQVATGAVAAWNALKELEAGHGVAAAKAVMEDWYRTADAQWKELQKTVAATFGDGPKQQVIEHARLVSDMSKENEAAAKAAEAAAARAAAAYEKELKAYGKLLEDIDKRSPLLTSNPFMDVLTFSSGAASDMTLGGMGMKAADRFLSDFSTGFGLHEEATLNPLAQAAGQRWGVLMGSSAGDSFDFPTWVYKASERNKAQLERAGARAGEYWVHEFQGAITDLFAGDFTKSWETLWKDLAKVSANTVSTGLFGGKDAQGNVIKGILAGGWGEMSSTQKWELAGSTVGGLAGAYGQQQNNQGMGALGGAISGAAATWETGNPVIIAAAAIIGAAMGYYGAQGPSKMGYNFQAGTTPYGNIDQMGYSGVGNAPQSVRVGAGLYGVDVNYGGPDAATMKNMAEQLADKATQTTENLRSMLDAMGQAFANPAWSVTGGVGQSTSDVSTVFNTFLNSTMPQAIFKAFQPLLLAGMTTGTQIAAAPPGTMTGGLGISAGRAAAELAAVINSSNFDQAMLKLQAYIQAVVDLQKLHEDLGKSLEQLSTELTRDTHAAWQAAMSDTLDQIGKLSENLDQLTSDEQVTRAQQIKDLTETQYQNNLKYLQQILQAQQSVDQSFSDLFTSFDEARAKASGPDSLAAFYQNQLLDLANKLKAATSPEQVQQITQQMQKYGSALWQMGTVTDFSGAQITQQWTEQFLKTQQATADAMLQQWAQQTADANKQLSDALAGITDALNSEVAAHQDVTGALGDEAVAHDMLTQSINDEATAHESLRQSLEDATDTLNLFVNSLSPGHA